MARQGSGVRRKLVEFDEETWRALDLLMRDQMKSLEELSGEAFRDLLRKHGQPENLKAALRESARVTHQATKPTSSKPTTRRRKSAGFSKRQS
jgi:hypothetical protein